MKVFTLPGTDAKTHAVVYNPSWDGEQAPCGKFPRGKGKGKVREGEANEVTCKACAARI